MDIGRMNKAVSLQRVVRTPSPEGFAEVWTTYAEPRVAIEPATPRSLETLTSATVTSPISHLVTMPYVADVHEADRVLFVDRVQAHALYIASIQNLNMDNRVLVLGCEERDTDG